MDAMTVHDFENILKLMARAPLQNLKEAEIAVALKFKILTHIRALGPVTDVTVEVSETEGATEE